MNSGIGELPQYRSTFKLPENDTKELTLQTEEWIAPVKDFALKYSRISFEMLLLLSPVKSLLSDCNQNDGELLPL
eukprot:m.64708 g.64708  ORF g.64708 m.64708 type:complete len:75 (+) comp11668_c0_seq1:105-329(+)